MSMIFLLLPHFLNYWCLLGRIHPPILLNQSILKVTHTIGALMKTQTSLLLVLTNTTTWHSSCVATILSLACIQQTCRQNTAFIYNFEDICSWTLKWNVTNVSKLWMKEREKWRSDFVILIWMITAVLCFMLLNSFNFLPSMLKVSDWSTGK